jgi:hypothetical protein
VRLRHSLPERGLVLVDQAFQLSYMHDGGNGGDGGGRERGQGVSGMDARGVRRQAV